MYLKEIYIKHSAKTLGCERGPLDASASHWDPLVASTCTCAESPTLGRDRAKRIEGARRIVIGKRASQMSIRVHHSRVQLINERKLRQYSTERGLSLPMKVEAQVREKAEDSVSGPKVPSHSDCLILER